MRNSDMAYQRILLKVSGEALMGENEFGYDDHVVADVAAQIVDLQKNNVQVALVLGGGNIFRGEGLKKCGIDPVRADQMGMLATVMNGIAMQDAIRKQGAECELMSALSVNSCATQYNTLQAREYLDQGKVVILAGGTGNPFFTTDSCASLRAIELNADIMLKATQVDGIYDSDPKINPEAKRYERLSFDEAISKELKVMDLTAMVLCRDHAMKIMVYRLGQENALKQIVAGSTIGTLVS